MKIGTTFFLLFSASCFSQSYNFRIYSIEEGIPQSQVHTIFQDRDGFMWFGTDGGGLARFDGKKFALFTTTEGLCNDLVYSLAGDSTGKLWIATAKGLSVFYKNHFIEIPAALKPLSDLLIRNIFIDSRKIFYFSTTRGAFKYDGKFLEKIGALEEKIVLCISEDSRGRHWFGTSGNGVFCVTQGGEISRLTVKNGLSNNTVSALIPGDSGKLYIGTDNGIDILSQEKIKRLPLPALPLSKQVMRSFYFDKENNLWAGTSDCGLYRISPGEITRFGKNEGLGIEGVFCTLEDREGNLWIGTDGNGTAKLGVRTFTSISRQNGMPDEMILSVLKDSRGNWWYGNDDGVTMYDGKIYTHYDSKNGLSDEKVWCIMENADGKIWISTYGSGIFVYDPASKKFINYSAKNGLSDNNVRAVFRDSKGQVWAGTANGLNIFNGKEFKQVISPSLSAKRFLCFYEDNKHNLWIGTSTVGLAKLEGCTGTSFKTYSEKEGLADNVVLSIKEDENGNIWTGNFGGISKLNPSTGEIKKITKKDGLSSNTVYAICFVDSASLLAGTNNGVDKLDLSEYNRSGKVVTKHFGKEEGFAGVECNTNSVLKEKDGKILFGTIKGVFIYDPLKDVKNTAEPVTHITNARLFFENFNHVKYADVDSASSFLPAHMTFPYDQNHLTFDFTGLSFTIPKKVKYRYMMSGFDKDYTQPVSETFATYSNLLPGNYSFRVLACNNDGKWNTLPAVFNFTITPPFWKTWWFRIGAGAAILLSVYGFFKYRIRRLKRIQQMLEEQVALKTKELREEKEIVEKQNKQITSSIRYAKRIQDSILPLKEKLNELIPESFIFFRPKDIVSGDFYWFSRVKARVENNETSLIRHSDYIIVAAADCTGHGVPGAFMSLIGNNLLNNIVNNEQITDPKIILEKLHEGVVFALKKDEQESGTVDGMDITLCVLDVQNGTMEFSSSGRPLILVKQNELKKIKIGRHPVGLVTKNEAGFEKEKIALQKGDRVYIFTDGYCDQFGGEEDDKFMDGNFEKVLYSIKNKEMNEQAAILEKTISEWKGNRPQLDDILVIGIKV